MSPKAERILEARRNNPKMSHQKIADLVGCSRPTVSLVLERNRVESLTYVKPPESPQRVFITLDGPNKAWALERRRVEGIKLQDLINSCITDARLDDEEAAAGSQR